MFSRTTLRQRLLAGAAATIALAVAAPSFAADTAAAAADTTAAAPGDAPIALEAVIVTATKRETDLQKTPIAISVVGGEQLEARHVESLLNLADGAVPSLRVATFE